MFIDDFISLIKFKVRPFKAKFIPNKIFSDLDSRKNDLYALRMYLRKFCIRIVNIPYDELTIGGEFDEEEFILLRIHGDYENIKFNDEEWFNFKFRLVQVLMHELIHWKQYINRGHGDCKTHNFISKHSQAEYYSSHDEIEAFAHCIYLELQREYPGISVLNTIENYGGETYDFIFNTVFKKDFNNKALKQYVKEILKWEKIYKNS